MAYNFSSYEPTFNRAIDLCANLIACARANQKALKSITLKPINYEWFKSGVQTIMDRELEDGELMQFDGVNIEKGSLFQKDTVLLEYYNQAEA